MDVYMARAQYAVKYKMWEEAASTCLKAFKIKGLAWRAIFSSTFSALARSFNKRIYVAATQRGVDHNCAVTRARRLLRPTDFVYEALEILRAVPGVHALINITGDGLINLARATAPVGFALDALIEPHPIFKAAHTLVPKLVNCIRNGPRAMLCPSS